MKKKFISVAMFCALIASTPVWVGCSDYDDDIANLQSQVDDLKGSNVTTEEAKAAINEAITALKKELETAIAGKADNAVVVELQNKVTELTTALDSKADAQTVASLVQDVQNLIERVNGVEGTLSETKKELEGKLADLQKSYEAADKLLEESIAQKANSEEVTKLQGELQDAQAKLEATIKDLEALKGEGNAAKIEELTKKIEELTGKYNDAVDKLAEKADKATVDELNKKLEGIEADLVNYVKKSEVEALQNQLNTLNDELGKRPTSAEVASQIDEKIKALGDLVTVNVFEEYKTNIATQLGKLTDEIADNKSEIDRIGKLAEENGQSIVDLTGRIGKLEEILDGFEQGTPGSEIPETVLGQIIALTNRVELIDGENGALAQLKAQYATLNTELGKMQQKLTETQLNVLNDIAEWDSKKNGSIVSVLEKVIALEEALNAKNEEGEPAFDLTDIATQLSDLQAQLEQFGLMAKMIQSIVFVPNAIDNNGVTLDKRVSFKTLQLYNNANPTGYWKTIAENKQQAIRFRISPATLTKEDFEKRYDIQFYGSQVAKRDLSTALKDVKVVSLQDGLLTLNVTAGETVGNGDSYYAWALSAHVTPKADVEGNETYTDIFSDYFVVDNSVDQVQNIKVVTTENDGVNDPSSYQLTYDDRTTQIQFAADQKLIGVTSGNSEIALATEYPTFAPTVTYAQSGDSYYFDFDANSATLSLKDNVNQSAIGQETTVTATVTVNGLNNSYSTAFKKVSIVQATPEYEVTGVQTADWFVGTAKKIYTVSQAQIREIMTRSDMTATQFWASVSNGTASGMNGYVYFKVNGQEIEIWQKAQTNIPNGTIEFKFNTNETGNVFTLKAKIAAMTDAQYPQLTINRESAAWSGNTIGLLPQQGTVVTLERDLKTVFSDYSNTLSTATAKGGTLSFKVYSNGVDATNTFVNGTTLKIDPSIYTGQTLRFELQVAYGSKMFVVDGGNVQVQDLSGSWIVNKTQTFNPLNRTMNTTQGIDLSQGFEWKDYEGQTMWKDGNNTGLTKYALTAPTFKIVSGANQYIELNGRTLNFKSGTENNFLEAHTVVIEVVAQSKWGSIEGYNDATKFITVTIPAGTYTR